MTVDGIEDVTADDVRGLEAEDGWSEAHGIEKCPVCGVLYTMNGGYTGPVADTTGNVYDHQLDSDPEDGPLLCIDCWEGLRQEVRDEISERATREQHATLDSFGGGTS